MTGPILINVATRAEIALKAETMVGRRPAEGHPTTCDVELEDKKASRRHARITLVGVDVWVEDCGSQNGTYVNDQRIQSRVQLKSGDRVRFNREEYELKLPVSDDGATEIQSAEETKMRKADPAEIVVPAKDTDRRPPAWIDFDNPKGGGTEIITKEKLEELMRGPVKDGNAAAIQGPHLWITSGKLQGSRIRLLAGVSEARRWRIGGKESMCNVVLPDQGVSGLHASLVNQGKHWKLSDEQSANGTFVNEEHILTRFLSPNDRLRFGPVQCVFVLSQSTVSGNMSWAAPPGKLRMFWMAAIGTALIIGTALVLARILGF